MATLTWRQCVGVRSLSCRPRRSGRRGPCVRGLVAEHRVANAEVRVRFPPSAPVFKHGGRQRAQSGLQDPTRSGQHRPTVPVRVMIRPAVRKTAVSKEGRKTTSGALPPSPTNRAIRKRNSRLACLSSRRQRGQHPSGSPFCGHEEDSNPPGLGPGDTRGRTEVPDHFPTTPSSEYRTPSF